MLPGSPFNREYWTVGTWNAGQGIDKVKWVFNLYISEFQ
jgi:hypothetical protein